MRGVDELVVVDRQRRVVDVQDLLRMAETRERRRQVVAFEAMIAIVLYPRCTGIAKLFRVELCRAWLLWQVSMRIRDEGLHAHAT